MLDTVFPQGFRFFKIMAEEPYFRTWHVEEPSIGLPNIHEYNRIFTNINEHPRIKPNIYEYNRTPTNITEHSRI